MAQSFILLPPSWISIFETQNANMHIQPVYGRPFSPSGCFRRSRRFFGLGVFGRPRKLILNAAWQSIWIGNLGAAAFAPASLPALCFRGAKRVITRRVCLCARDGGRVFNQAELAQHLLYWMPQRERERGVRAHARPRASTGNADLSKNPFFFYSQCEFGTYQAGRCKLLNNHVCRRIVFADIVVYPLFCCACMAKFDFPSVVG